LFEVEYIKKHWTTKTIFKEEKETTALTRRDFSLIHLDRTKSNDNHGKLNALFCISLLVKY